MKTTTTTTKTTLKYLKSATPKTLDTILTQTDKIFDIGRKNGETRAGDYELYHKVAEVVSGTLGYDYDCTVMDNRVLENVQNYVDERM